MSDEPLHIKYRPTAWDEVVGQDAVVTSLTDLVGKARAFLFSSQLPGVGKTTMARIAAREFGCTDSGMVELDAATHTGIDDVRGIQELLRYKAFGKGGKRAIIIDEAHGLSRQAWDSLLKSIEQPPSHIIWFLCTTNLGKVPETIRSRCMAFELKAVDYSTLFDYLGEVCDAEKIKLKEGVQSLCAKEAGGSVRQALVNLQVCRNAKNQNDAADLLSTALEGDAVIELCRLLASGQANWKRAMNIVSKLEDQNPEGIRILVTRYFRKAAQGSDGKKACYFLNILDHFSTPYNPAEGHAPLVLALGHIIFDQ